MDFELDLSSENMTSFLELEQEIKEATTNLPEHLLRPSVIVQPRAKPAAQPNGHHDQLRHRVRAARGVQRLLSQQH